MAKSLVVKLKLSSDKLRELPDVPSHSLTTNATPAKAKLKVKKPAPASSLNASPTPETPKTSESTPAPSTKSSNLSKVVNAEDFKLDKSGKPVRRWTKKPINIQSFTGYYMKFSSWTGMGSKDIKKEDGADEEIEEETNDENTNHPPLKIQIKLNNKKLDLKDDDSVMESREQSPDVPSSMVSSPDVSRAGTPLHN
ncbi:CYFA0S04e03642g1_1 [Cyberlindnera fabianii]|uniref:CYFA0S04e03642g1_1 n=1 Tax=Cyberlindnera fabianii TaxID=36022 RepID=A0A061AXJ5_CYBFA|nr:hypothetical protein BON22_2415 [Cyberlindnera fabianii]CDR40102.1 CYFA0S04e03642g1_1 [Cyberlindnera fabianii]